MRAAWRAPLLAGLPPQPEKSLQEVCRSTRVALYFLFSGRGELTCRGPTLSSSQSACHSGASSELVCDVKSTCHPLVSIACAGEPLDTPLAAAALGHAARLAAALLPVQQAEAIGNAAVAAERPGVTLAARLMEVGARAADAWPAAAMKPHLARLLSGLCSPPCAAGSVRCGKHQCP